MLDGLSPHAHRRLRAALTAAEVVPLLLRAQEECSSAAAQIIFGWAVEHYEQVLALLDAWPLHASAHHGAVSTHRCMLSSTGGSRVPLPRAHTCRACSATRRSWL